MWHIPHERLLWQMIGHGCNATWPSINRFFVMFVNVALKMYELTSVGQLFIHTGFKFFPINYLESNEKDHIVIRKIHCKLQALFNVVGKSGIGVRHLARASSTYILYRGYHTFACEFVVEVAQKHIGH